MNKKRKEHINQLQDNLNSYWDSVNFDSIISVETTDNQSFMAIQLPKRELPGYEQMYYFIRLDKPEPKISLMAKYRIKSINGKSIENKTEWKVKGSSGYYKVRLKAGKLVCDCKGFMFRKKCKHVEQVKNEV